MSDEEPDLRPRPLSYYHRASEAILLQAPLIDLLEFILNISSFHMILQNTKRVFMKRI